jgi:hypothetical protein
VLGQMPDSSPVVVAAVEDEGVPPAAGDDDELQPAIAATHTEAPSNASIDLLFIWFAPGT